MASSQFIPKIFTTEDDQRFRTIQMLGTGGNCDVYLAIAVTGEIRGLLFAIKIFRNVSDKARLENFLKEIEFLKNCPHPAILNIVSKGNVRLNLQGESGTYPFAVMEYHPLTLRTALGKGLWLPQKVIYVMQLLSALVSLKSQNPQIVHRDIKPENIFIKGFSCSLGDFGLMKTLQIEDNAEKDDVFKKSMGPGMPRFFRTPDLVAYAKQEAMLTCASDVFQLGLVAALLFTGRNPLKKSDDKLDPVELFPIDEIPGTVGASIKDGIESMLIMNPGDRATAFESLEVWEAIMLRVSDDYANLEGRTF